MAKWKTANLQDVKYLILTLLQGGIQLDNGGAGRLDAHPNNQPDMASPFQSNQQAPNAMDQVCL